VRKINFEYLSPLKEPLWFGALVLRHAIRRRPHAPEGNLIVNVCLVGEFAASVPAMHALIKTLEGPVDLLVSPPLKELASRLRGVRRVFTARSSFARANEGGSDEALPPAYASIHVLRMSADAYRMLQPTVARTVQTGVRHYAGYGLHLGWRMVRGRTPKSWREVNFQMVRLPEHYAPLEEMFDFSPAEYAAVRTRPELAQPHKKVVIHTGASWVRNRWPREHWAELLKLLHRHGAYQIVFVGASKDRADFDAIASSLSFPIYSLIGTVSIMELLLVLHACDYFIGVDSGPRNLAHLAGLRSVTLLGPAPHMYTPPDSRDRVLDKSGGRRVLERFVATKGTSLMERHTPREVFEEFLKLR
jgi:ADP-heptose:LPS heptosyltransferase